MSSSAVPLGVGYGWASILGTGVSWGLIGLGILPTMLVFEGACSVVGGGSER